MQTSRVSRNSEIGGISFIISVKMIKNENSEFPRIRRCGICSLGFPDVSTIYFNRAALPGKVTCEESGL